MSNSVSLRVRGAVFGNPALRKSRPVTNNGFIPQGLLFAILPAVDGSSMMDLSGNGTSFETVGNPVWLPTGVKGNYANGFRTSVQETANTTLLTVSRLHRNMDVNNNGSLWGNVNFALNTYFTTAKGNSLRCGWSAGQPSGFYIQDQRAPSIGGVEPGGTARSYTLNSELSDVYDGATVLDAAWHFTASIIDADKAVATGYTKTPAYEKIQIASASTMPGLVGPNTFKNRPLETDQLWSIFCVPAGSTYNGQCTLEIAAAAVWRNALSLDDIKYQYKVLRNMLSGRGIAI